MAVWFLLLVVSTGIALATAVRINLSGSLPLGFYRLTDAGIERGALVVTCPDLTHPALQQAQERGYLAPGWGCDGGIAPLLKRVLALPGDQVVVQEDGIQVNGQKVERSARVSDPAGGTVPAGQVWVLGDAPASFDSRYFGPVSVLGAAVPLLTWQLISWHEVPNTAEARGHVRDLCAGFPAPPDGGGGGCRGPPSGGIQPSS